jgi:sulfur-oxidizing protein SoxZ
MADSKRKAMIKIKPKKYKVGDIVKVSLMAQHPMDTGMAKDKETGKIKPAHYINDVELAFLDKGEKDEKKAELFTKMKVWESISADPFFSVQYKVEKAGKIVVHFTDNLGETMTKTKKLKPKNA